MVSARRNSSNVASIIISRIFYSLKTIINQNRWVEICRTLLCERIDPRLSTNEDCFCWCYSIFSFQKRTTNYSLYRPLVQPPYLFLNHNNGFPIRLRFSLASNHCLDLAHDYRIVSVSHHEATIPLEKWTVSRFPFPIFPLQPLHPNARKLESFEITILLPLCLSIHPCSIWISICLVLKILVSRSEFLKPSSRRNLLP